MSRVSDPRKSFLPFGNPLRTIFPKGSTPSPKLLDLLNTFELSLSHKLRNLKPAAEAGILRLPWLKTAMKSLSEVHSDIKYLITALELPIPNWDDKWIDAYLDSSLKLLDISVALSSEISRLKHGNLLLQCTLHNLYGASPKQFVPSMERWRNHMSSSKNPKLENCFSTMDGFAQTLHLPNIKDSPKGKVLARAMYGVKAVTLCISNILASAFLGSWHTVRDMNVPEMCLWADAFNDLNNIVNAEIRSSVSSVKLKELEAVDVAVKKLSPIVENEAVEEDELLSESTSELEKAAGNLRYGLDLLGKEVDRFFQTVLTGRDAILCGVRNRIGNDVFAPDEGRPGNHYSKGEGGDG